MRKKRPTGSIIKEVSFHRGKLAACPVKLDIYLTGTDRNKFCFTGGLVVAAVSLPDTNNVQGMWPAVWTMGNLGRAGYGASLDGMWVSAATSHSRIEADFSLFSFGSQ